MGVNSLPKTVTRQRRGCDLNPGPSAPESSTLTTRLPSDPMVATSKVFISMLTFVGVLTRGKTSQQSIDAPCDELTTLSSQHLTSARQVVLRTAHQTTDCFQTRRSAIARRAMSVDILSTAAQL